MQLFWASHVCTNGDTILQEVAHWSLHLLWKAIWWREYECSRDGGKHIAEFDVTYFTLLLLKRSTFSSIGSFALKTFPNTVMGARCSHSMLAHSHLLAFVLQDSALKPLHAHMSVFHSV